MSKIKNMVKDVPPTENTFEIDVQGEVSRKRFAGEFKCRIPRRKELCLIDKHRAFLNGPLAGQLDFDTLTFHHMISYLRYTLVTEDSPKFWKETDLGYEMYDVNVVRVIYETVLQFEEDWMKAVWGEEHVNKLKNKSRQKDEQVEETKEESA